MLAKTKIVIVLTLYDKNGKKLDEKETENEIVNHWTNILHISMKKMNEVAKRNYIIKLNDDNIVKILITGEQGEETEYWYSPKYENTLTWPYATNMWATLQRDFTA